MKKLATEAQIDGWYKLTEIAKKELGEQATITCTDTDYLVQVFPCTEVERLGPNLESAIERLLMVAHWWHDQWAELQRRVDQIERGCEE